MGIWFPICGLELLKFFSPYVNPVLGVTSCYIESLFVSPISTGQFPFVIWLYPIAICTYCYNINICTHTHALSISTFPLQPHKMLGSIAVNLMKSLRSRPIWFHFCWRPTRALREERHLWTSWRVSWPGKAVGFCGDLPVGFHQQKMGIYPAKKSRFTLQWWRVTQQRLGCDRNAEQIDGEIRVSVGRQNPIDHIPMCCITFTIFTMLHFHHFLQSAWQVVASSAHPEVIVWVVWPPKKVPSMWFHHLKETWVLGECLISTGGYLDW